jgi:Tn3 transposase DDE domain
MIPMGEAALMHIIIAPRLRDLGDKRIYSIEKPETYPALAPLLGGTINLKQIERHWDDLLRLTGSIRKGTVTASLILGKLASYPRQNGLAWALRSHHPEKPSGFKIRRILGNGNLWVTEYVITYNGRPVDAVSILEFRAGKVVHETQYFASPFEAPAWRAQWVERMD